MVAVPAAAALSGAPSLPPLQLSLGHAGPSSAPLDNDVSSTFSSGAFAPFGAVNPAAVPTNSLPGIAKAAVSPVGLLVIGGLAFVAWRQGWFK